MRCTSHFLRALALSFVIALGGCAGGIAEFQLYDKAFDTQLVEANKVLDRLATAERKVYLRREAGISQSFDPDKARYYLTVGDPPLTASIRSSLKTIQAYNKSLVALSNGESAKALTARLGTLSSNILASAGAISVATGGGDAFVAAGAGILGRLLPVYQQAKSISDRAAFRKLLLNSYSDMHDLLLAMRAGSKDMYRLFRRSYGATPANNRAPVTGRARISAADLAKLKADRQLLAGWVILMDKTLLAMKTAAEAALRGGSPADIAALTEASIELRILAETIKQAQSGN